MATEIVKINFIILTLAFREKPNFDFFFRILRLTLRSSLTFALRILFAHNLWRHVARTRARKY